MFNNLTSYLKKPALYAPSTRVFWNDGHISKHLLEAHLNPELESATRKHDFVDASASWVAKLAPPVEYPRLLDLGCGPGIYARRFEKAGYSVVGFDFSERSIEYAKEQNRINKGTAEYHCRDYQSIDYKEQFDVVTLIYCDYAVFSAADRAALLKKVYQALKPGGRFIFDVFTPIMRKPEEHSWAYLEEGGFFSEKPHLCLDSVYQYADEDKTELRRAIVVTKEGVDCYNIWDHFFTREQLATEVEPAGFREAAFFGDVAGAPLSADSKTICAVLKK